MKTITNQNNFDNYLNSGYNLRSVRPIFHSADNSGFNCTYSMIAEKNTNRFLSLFNIPLLIGDFSTWRESVFQGKRSITHIATTEFYAATIEKENLNRRDEIAEKVLEATVALFFPDFLKNQQEQLVQKLKQNEETCEEPQLINKIARLPAKEFCLLTILVKALKDAEGMEEFNHQYFSANQERIVFDDGIKGVALKVYLKCDDETDESCILGGNTLSLSKDELITFIKAMAPRAIVHEFNL